MVTFCKPRHTYQSYTDFWRLVELCGYETIYIDEIDPYGDGYYIIATPDVNAYNIPDTTAVVIFWLLEWYGDYYQREGVTDTWCSNREFAAHIGAKYVPMGSHAKLGTKRTGSQFDIAHMSYDGIHRRRLVLDKLRDEGITIAPNGWGNERNATLKNTRAMLHIHQHADYPAIAPLRASLAAAYALPLLAENGWDTHPYTGIVLFDTYDNLVDATQSALKCEQLQSRGDALHELLCEEYRFDKVIQANV